jgi:Ca-activated chloride channel family protein
MSIFATLASLEFEWPLLLWVLIAVPLLAFAYLRLVARRRRVTSGYPLLETIGEAPTTTGRHLPALLVLAGLVFLLTAIARPHASLVMPARMDTIMLGIDISGSMRAGDVKPNRLKAAQDAAKTFIDAQPGPVKIGLVAIAGSAAVVQSPTRNREDLVQALDRLQQQRGTALGSGLAVSLATLLPDGGIDAGKIINGISSATAARGSAPSTPEAAPATKGKSLDAKSKAAPTAAGRGGATAIVLLTDGSSNTGPDPLEVGKIAADHGVRVFTIGVGTPEGATLKANGWSVRVRLDEEPLKKLAAMTSGEYFRAATATDLKRIYQSLGSRMVLERQQLTEVTALFAAIGAILALAGVLLSLRWHDRVL